MRALILLVMTFVLGCDRAPSSLGVAAKKQAECGQASDDTVRIMRGLAPSCEGCHLNGARAFFA